MSLYQQWKNHLFFPKHCHGMNSKPKSRSDKRIYFQQVVYGDKFRVSNSLSRNQPFEVGSKYCIFSVQKVIDLSLVDGV